MMGMEIISSLLRADTRARAEQARHHQQKNNRRRWLLEKIVNAKRCRQEGLTDDFQSSIDHHSFITLTLDHDSGSLEPFFADDRE